MSGLIDPARPPVRPGPRTSGWPFALLLFIGSSFLVLLAIVFDTLAGVVGLEDVIVVSLAFVAAVLLSYAMYRRSKATSIPLYTIGQATDDALGDPEAGRRRPADREELRAWKQWKQHRISRAEYEHIMAYRKFVHAELSTQEYQGAIRQIKETWPGSQLKGP